MKYGKMSNSQHNSSELDIYYFFNHNILETQQVHRGNNRKSPELVQDWEKLS